MQTWLADAPPPPAHTHPQTHTHPTDTNRTLASLPPLSECVWGGGLSLSRDCRGRLCHVGDCADTVSGDTQSPLQPPTPATAASGGGGGGGRTTPSEPSPDSLAASFAASLFATGFRVAARAMEAGPRVSPGHFWQVELFSSYNRSLFLL